MLDFKPIPGYAPYGANPRGEIANLKTQRVRKCPSINNCGYRLVTMRINGKQVCRSVQRLMGYAFLGLQESDKRVVDHIDGDKLNNQLNNLRLLSQKENLLNRRSSEYKMRHPKQNISIKKDKARAKKYYLRIERNGKAVVSKLFFTLEDAQDYRDKFY